MSANYTFSGGSQKARSGSGLLPAGDYAFSVLECQEPYQKDNGNWVLKVRLAIEPSEQWVWDQPWSGVTSAGDARDGIGDFLVAVNRAPAQGAQPDWRKVVGAKGRCKLKIELAQIGALAGKEVNRVHFYYRPKELSPPRLEEHLPEPIKKIAQQADSEPQDIPF